LPNPTNIAHLPNSFEAKIVDLFEQDPNLKELSGYQQVAGKELMFYTAKPLLLKKESCLRCHSVPSAAPKAMLAVYGDKHG
jgi:Protein of unknown function (DUF3365)